MNRIVLLLLLPLLSIFVSKSFAQFSGSNLLNFQLGNQARLIPTNKTNVYNQLNLRYRQDQMVFGLRAETYKTSHEDEYNSISQKYLRYTKGDLRVQIGSFYETLGRGLLLRTYEIPGSIHESSGQRYGLYKDIEGISIRFDNDYISTKMLYGKPLDNSISPSSKTKRREVLAQGGELNLHINDFITPGVLYLRSDYEDNSNIVLNEYAGTNMDFQFDNWQLYSEYTQEFGSGNDIIGLGKNSAHAFYISGNASFENLSFSLEYKDYNDFILNFNDPPSLAKEHSFSLANRATHTTNLSNENGWQAEVLIDLDDFNTITLNHARAVIDLFGKESVFEEYYIDLNYYFNDRTLIKAFTDYSMDESENQFNRYTAGVLFENQISGMWSVSNELQYQQFDVDLPYNNLFGDLDHSVKTFVVNSFISQSRHFSIGASLEISNDPQETDRLIGGKKVFVSWPSLNASYQYDQDNDITLFYGKRRGGNTCTGGICFEVVSFEGLELSLRSRF
ncbi:MAG: hypothetical protein D8M58_08205 [Calditrichaeota bacterium]|nr:MAG: hypothetical protein DWQ03_18285 [Calditrichota bacterium]MBL1205365.1 hypothetical protein [Calditrichota bacterium]NOG45194.1 hypothetical protein [Calditrichota bacterium]